MEINPNWFEDMISFLALYALTLMVAVLFFGWKIYEWWSNLNDDDDEDEDDEENDGRGASLSAV